MFTGFYFFFFFFFIHWIKGSNKHNTKCLSALVCFLPTFRWKKGNTRLLFAEYSKKQLENYFPEIKRFETKKV